MQLYLAGIELIISIPEKTLTLIAEDLWFDFFAKNNNVKLSFNEIDYLNFDKELHLLADYIKNPTPINMKEKSIIFDG